jgi:hypothetical protein
VAVAGVYVDVSCHSIPLLCVWFDSAFLYLLLYLPADAFTWNGVRLVWNIATAFFMVRRTFGLVGFRHRGCCVVPRVAAWFRAAVHCPWCLCYTCHTALLLLPATALPNTLLYCVRTTFAYTTCSTFYYILPAYISAYLCLWFRFCFRRVWVLVGRTGSGWRHGRFGRWLPAAHMGGWFGYSPVAFRATCILPSRCACLYAPAQVLDFSTYLGWLFATYGGRWRNRWTRWLRVGYTTLPLALRCCLLPPRTCRVGLNTTAFSTLRRLVSRF